MRLYDCKYAGGRAEAAPELRRGERLGVDIKEANSLDELMALPHELNTEEMDRLYPELIAPEDVDIDESLFVPKDYLGEHGAKIAESIMDQARAYGRKRFSPDEPRSRAQEGGAGERGGTG